MPRGLHPTKLRNIKEYKQLRWRRGATRNTDFQLAQRKREKFMAKEGRAAHLIESRRREDADYKKKLKKELAGGIDPKEKREMQSMSKDELNDLVKSQQRVLLSEMEESLRKEMAEVEKAGIQEKMRVYSNTLPRWVKTLLPIKHTTGRVEERFTSKKQKKVKTLADIKPTEDKLKIKTKSTLDLLVERKEKLREIKVQIGCLASSILGDPQMKIRSLKTLGNFLKEADPEIEVTVKKYAALSILEVFSNIIPQYKIEPDMLKKLKEADSTLRFKKEKKIVFQYEEIMLNEYKHYLIDLENILAEKKKSSNPAVKNLVKVVLHCYCELLLRHSHFNFTNNIIQAITPFADHRDPKVAEEIQDTYAQLFKRDKEGHLSLEIVKRMAYYIRKQHFKVKPHFMKPFLHIRAADESNLDVLIEAKLNAKKKLTHTEKLIRKVKEERKPKKSRQELKKSKKQRILEEKVKDIVNDKKEKFRHSLHAKILQIVFGLYIHVLKRKPNAILNEIVLEGLAKFAHLINIEYFSDLLDVLGCMMLEGTMNFRESMYSIKTVFTILSGQGEALTLDPRQFFTYLYANMLSMSRANSAVMPALDALRMMLVERQKSVSTERCLAFSKRLCTISLSLPLHNSTLAALALQRSIMTTNASTSLLLETDSEGTSGLFSPEVDEPEHSNASATAYFEFTLLNRHYHTEVKKMTHHLMHGAPSQGEGALPLTLLRKPMDTLYELYNPSKMQFNPIVPLPDTQVPKKQITKMKMQRTRSSRFVTPYMMRQADTVEDLVGKSEVNGHETNGYDHEDEEMEVDQEPEEVEDIDFFSGLINNMDLTKIPDRQEVEEDEEGWNQDISDKLLSAEFK